MTQKMTVYTRQGNRKAIAEIKGLLAKGLTVEVHNQHETFYGFGFDRWLEESMADTPCTIKATAQDRYLGFASEFIVSPK